MGAPFTLAHPCHATRTRSPDPPSPKDPFVYFLSLFTISLIFLYPRLSLDISSTLIVYVRCIFDLETISSFYELKSGPVYCSAIGYFNRGGGVDLSTLRFKWNCEIGYGATDGVRIMMQLERSSFSCWRYVNRSDEINSFFFFKRCFVSSMVDTRVFGYLYNIFNDSVIFMIKWISLFFFLYM